MSKTQTATPMTGEQIRQLRLDKGVNQSDFWGKLGVTQSAGSRYESDRQLPKPTAALFRLVHEEGINIAKLKGADVAAIDYLKATDPEGYKALVQKAAKAKKKVAA
jgi:transcriptional regulator with XRE-family HTH domain